jgi:hypothetical protein
MTETFVPSATRDGVILYRASYAPEAEGLCSRGATEVELAKHFGVSLAQIQLWCVCHPDFRAAVRVGGEVADQRVTMALYRRATGYEIEEPDQYVKKDGTVVTVVRRRHVPADPSAAQYWLENRAPDKWQRKVGVHHSGEVASVVRVPAAIEDADEWLRKTRPAPDKTLQ